MIQDNLLLFNKEEFKIYGIFRIYGKNRGWKLLR